MLLLYDHNGSGRKFIHIINVFILFCLARKFYQEYNLILFVLFIPLMNLCGHFFYSYIIQPVS